MKSLDSVGVSTDPSLNPSLAAMHLGQVTLSGLSFLLCKKGGLTLTSLGCENFG